MKLVFLDTETTGNEPKKDRLCQLCYRVGDKVRSEYFKPPIPIPPEASEITHITDKTVADKPAFRGSSMHKELDTILQDHVLVAHNAPFDCAILNNEGVVVPRKICTLKVARHLDSNNSLPNHRLQFLRYYLGLEVEAEAHDAKGDVAVLHALFERLLAKMMETIPDRDKAIEEMIEISNRPSIIKKITFGKHKDKLVVDVLKEDRGYLEWLLKTKLESDKDEEDWIYTLKHFLGIKK